MRFKFWKREKKSLSLREAKEMTEEWNRQAPYATNLGDLSTADNITDEDIEHFRKKREKKIIHGNRTSEIRGFKADFVIDDDVSNEDKLEKWNRQKPHVTNVDVDSLTKEDQCHGKLKSGARCSRVVKDSLYCYQHRN